MARKFLYLIAFVTGLILLAGVVWTLYADDLMRLAMEPKGKFEAPAPVTPNAYEARDMWIARPDISGNPGLWRPQSGVTEDADAAGYAVFYVHPTTYLTSKHWNAPLDDKQANDLARLFTRGQASPFNKSLDIWAPRYRQAAFGAFLTAKPDAKQALDAAFADVELAFDAFLKGIKPGQPIVLVGHSQGALHLMTLLHKRIAGSPLGRRIVAAYVIGWPIGVAADLPALGLPACARADQSGCILSWQSFAEPAQYGDIVAAFEAQPGLAGRSRKGDRFLCTNPLTGTIGAAAPASANHGTLKSSADFASADLVSPGLVGARCDPQGILLIGNGPDMGPALLPGNNYHVYDFSLFWRDIRTDIERRSRAWHP